MIPLVCSSTYGASVHVTRHLRGEHVAHGVGASAPVLLFGGHGQEVTDLSAIGPEHPVQEVVEDLKVDKDGYDVEKLGNRVL